MLRALAPDLWVADRPLEIIVGDVGARMTVIRLADGGLVLHSPVRLDGETRAGLDGLGPVRPIVLPSLVHHLFAADGAVAYPAAEVHATPGMAEKRRDLRIDHVLSDEAPALWRDEIAQRLVQGAPRL